MYTPQNLWFLIRTPLFGVLLFDSSGLNEPLAAVGTADADLAAAPGDTDGLMAAGAAEVAVVLVLQVGEEIQERGVLPAAGFDVLGVHPEDAPQQRDIGHQTAPGGQGELAAQEAADEHQHDARTQQIRIEFIRAVAADHKIPEPVSDSAKHRNHPVFVLVLLL